MAGPQGIGRVLVATDGSDGAVRATATAIRLLGSGMADVRLIVVLSFELDPYTLLGEDMADTPARERKVEDAVEEATVKPRRLLEEAGHRVEVNHRFGNAADEILAEIDEWDPDLVVLGRQGLSGPRRWLLGSVSERVLRHAHVPVLVVS